MFYYEHSMPKLCLSLTLCHTAILFVEKKMETWHSYAFVFFVLFQTHTIQGLPFTVTPQVSSNR